MPTRDFSSFDPWGPFKTPEQILAHYLGKGNSTEYTVKCCPKCESINFVLCTGFLRRGLRRCEDCKNIFGEPGEAVKQYTEQRTPEESVAYSTLSRYELRHQLIEALAPMPARPGALDALAQIGMYSSDPTRARESIILTVQRQIQMHSQNQLRSQAIAGPQRQLEEEFQEALRRNHEYFHGDEIRAAAQAAQEKAQAQSDDESRRFARLLAEEMANVMEERRSR